MILRSFYDGEQKSHQRLGTSSQGHFGKTDIARVFMGGCEMNCLTAKSSARSMKPKSLLKDEGPLYHQGTTRAIISMDQRPNSVGLFTNAHTLADSTFWCMSAPSTPVVRHSRQSNRIAIRFRTLTVSYTHLTLPTIYSV